VSAAATAPTVPWRPSPDGRGVALHDVDNVEAFVWGAIGGLRRQLRAATDQVEDWHALGMVAMGELAVEYRPRLPGYQQGGSFAGYASSRLRFRLIDAWHSLQGHRYVTRADRRVWEQGPTLVSLEALRDLGDDDGESVEQFGARLREGLRQQLPPGFDDVLELCSRIGLLFAQGMGEREVAVELGVPLRDVRAAEGWLADAVERLE
jgi:hypothetical protein